VDHNPQTLNLQVGAVDPAFPGIFAATRAVGCSLSADVSTDVTASAQDMTVLNLGRDATAADDALNVAVFAHDPQPSTLNPQPSTLNPQLSTSNPKPCTLNPEPCTLHPEP